METCVATAGTAPRAAEVLAERWTFLVIRNLMFGADTFSELKAGVPQMSRSVLVTRLRELERAEVVRRTPKTGGGHRYELTEAGRDLVPVIDALAAWGERWVEIGPGRSSSGTVAGSRGSERSPRVGSSSPDNDGTRGRCRRGACWSRASRETPGGLSSCDRQALVRWRLG